MPHLLIQNPGEVTLSNIRVLGRSNKKPNAIGQFGTGLKEAVALAYRLHSNITIYSGTRRIDFSVQNIEGKEICFKLEEPWGTYSEQTWHPLGLDPNFGHHDWNSPWQVLREFFSNALDECQDPSFLHHALVEDHELYGAPNATRVYLRMTPELHAAYLDIGKKFLMLGSKEPLAENKHGRVYEPEYGDTCQLYTKGVWVQKAHIKGIFNYDLNNLRLNESRSADWYMAFFKISDVLMHSSEPIVTKLIQEAQKPTWEKRIESQALNVLYLSNITDEMKQTWQDAWNCLYSSQDIAASADVRDYQTTFAGNLVIFPREFYTLLQKLGIKNVDGEITERAKDTGEYPQINKDTYDFLLQTKFPMIHSTFRTTKIFVNPDLKVPYELRGDHIHIQPNPHKSDKVAAAIVSALATKTLESQGNFRALMYLAEKLVK